MKPTCSSFLDCSDLRSKWWFVIWRLSQKSIQTQCKQSRNFAIIDKYKWFDTNTTIPFPVIINCSCALLYRMSTLTPSLYQGLSSSDIKMIDYNDVMGDKNRDGWQFFSKYAWGFITHEAVNVNEGYRINTVKSNLLRVFSWQVWILSVSLNRCRQTDFILLYYKSNTY